MVEFRPQSCRLAGAPVPPGILLASAVDIPGGCCATWIRLAVGFYLSNDSAVAHAVARERLVRYLLHPPFALDRLHYDSDTGTVIYHPATKGSEQHGKSDPPAISSALDWLAAVVTHIPDKGQQLLRYYGHYSNVRQAQKKRAGAVARGLETTQPSPEEDGEFRKQCRSNWARLIKKVYEVDPLTCPRCHALMQIISFIEDPAVIKKILQHLKLWEVPKRSPPAKTPPRDFIYDPDFFGGLTS
jgi:hypothetical protein